MSKSSKRIDGVTSLGLPGVQGIKGIRSRVFFYGNSAVQDTDHKKIYFGTTQSDVDSHIKYAIITDDSVEPEEYDYIMYTTTRYDYLLIIRSVKKFEDYYECIVQKIDTLDLTKSSNDAEISFYINTTKRTIEITKRDALNYDYDFGWLGNIYSYIMFPQTSKDTTSGELIDITLSVPSNSTYEFDSNIKIVVEFYSNQSFIMDTTLADKYNGSGDYKDTYRGDHNLYSLIKKDSSDTWIQEDVNFDDERIENFTYIIKDFNDKENGSKGIVARFPLMLSSLKRPYSNKEAYIFAYIKNGKFVDKYLIGKFDLDFIDSGDDSSTFYDYKWNSRSGDSSVDSSVDPYFIDNPVVPIIPDITDLTWTCNCCGTTGNNGDYCSNCGNERHACQEESNPGDGGGESDVIKIEIDDSNNPDFGN